MDCWPGAEEGHLFAKPSRWIQQHSQDSLPLACWLPSHLTLIHTRKKMRALSEKTAGKVVSHLDPGLGESVFGLLPGFR